MDSISQMLTIVRNGVMAKLEKVDMPSSKMRESLAKKLEETGYIRSFKVAKDSKQGIMRIYLKYNESGEPAITSLKKVSLPGRRSYVGAQNVPQVRSGMGICILSTNKGILTGSEAKSHQVGGELLCLVW